jgi:hypothetical protein
MRLRRIASTMAVAGAIAATTGCGVEVGPGYPTGYYDDGYPSDAYIATTEPVYFEGRPTYWYGGRWNYRDGGRWNHYDREPVALGQRRVQSAPRQRMYEQRPAAHSVRGSGGGHR